MDKKELINRSINALSAFDEISAMTNKEKADYIGIGYPNYYDIRTGAKNRLPNLSALSKYHEANEKNDFDVYHYRPINWVAIITGEETTRYEKDLEKKVAALSATIDALETKVKEIEALSIQDASNNIKKLDALVARLEAAQKEAPESD